MQYLLLKKNLSICRPCSSNSCCSRAKCMLLFFSFFSSAKTAKEMIYCTHYIQPQLRTELVQNDTGPGQRTKRGRFFFFFFFNKFIYLFIFGCVGSLFLCKGFLQFRRGGATLHRGARASHCRGLSHCGAQAPDAQAQ